MIQNDTSRLLTQVRDHVEYLRLLGMEELPVADPRDLMQELLARVAACTDCPLHENALNPVFGEGPLDARIMFVGEGPGESEDRKGRPFVGKAGQLLTKMIEAMGITREQVYICNVVKHRPPRNRDPEPREVTACLGFLEKQIALVNPQVIVTLGNVPTKALLKTTEGITAMRGRWHQRQGVMVRPTYHPSFLLRNEGTPQQRQAKAQAWEDLRAVMSYLEMEPNVSK